MKDCPPGEAAGSAAGTRRGWYRAHLVDPLTATSLSTRFVIASFFVVCTTMFLTGAWVDARIKKTVFRNAAVSSARIIAALLQQHLQDLPETHAVSDTARAVAKGLTGDAEHWRRIVQIKVWLPDGTIAYTTEGTQIGEKPPMPSELVGALAGTVMADFDNLDDIESVEERKYGIPLFEVYGPIYKTGTHDIIGAVEFYEDAASLKAELAASRQQSWIVIGLLTVGMLSLLFRIVHRGTLLINDQRQALETTIDAQSALLLQNEELRHRITKAGQDSAALSDRLLRRVGADLHDGPAQLLGLSLLRLHELSPARLADPSPPATKRAEEALETIRGSMQDALAEIRNISSGVSLPELSALSVEGVIDLAISSHERRTGTTVGRDIGVMPENMSQSAKTCIFRCVQECLNNSFRHAEGHGQTVRANATADAVHVTVEDAGPGMDPAKLNKPTSGLGLTGLRHRAELLNGNFDVRSAPGQGTIVSVSIPREGANEP